MMSATIKSTKRGWVVTDDGGPVNFGRDEQAARECFSRISGKAPVAVATAAKPEAEGRGDTAYSVRVNRNGTATALKHGRNFGTFMGANGLTAKQIAEKAMSQLAALGIK